MFKFDPDPTFKTKVEISRPGDKPQTLTVEYKYLRKPQAKDYFDGLADRDDLDALQEIIVGWDAKEAGREYSPENLESLLENYPTAAGDLFTKFRRELLESRAKN